MAYKLIANLSGFPSTNVQRLEDKASIPFDFCNRDCAKFLADWEAGASVIDVDGIPLAYTQANVEALGLPFS